jgi:hypothetical protein
MSPQHIVDESIKSGPPGNLTLNLLIKSEQNDSTRLFAYLRGSSRCHYNNLLLHVIRP